MAASASAFNPVEIKNTLDRLWDESYAKFEESMKNCSDELARLNEQIQPLLEFKAGFVSSAKYELEKELERIQSKLYGTFTEERIDLLRERKVINSKLAAHNDKEKQINQNQRILYSLDGRKKLLENNTHDASVEFCNALNRYHLGFNEKVKESVHQAMKVALPKISDFYNREIEQLEAEVAMYDEYAKEARQLFLVGRRLNSKRDELYNKFEEYDDQEILPPAEIIDQMNETLAEIERVSLIDHPGKHVKGVDRKRKRIKTFKNLAKCPWTQKFTFEKVNNCVTIEEFTREVKRAFCPNNEDLYDEIANLLISYINRFTDYGVRRNGHLGKQKVPRVDDYQLYGR